MCERVNGVGWASDPDIDQLAHLLGRLLKSAFVSFLLLIGRS